ncbi:acetyl-CoA carboxylase biotin carboxyl carrier protein [Nocardia neocaledoniensis]|uniref:acetyl-CoA carboxylase biotin carboxyl carrier protein n=1 Tax=Nocardia neocaledoniensis TaxID=236511 RepID=UPI002455CA71|nr:acetyl-CoA carboxylase biotin carboxyl carrier protein subunit [Nocardia neocaledoniensis]
MVDFLIRHPLTALRQGLQRTDPAATEPRDPGAAPMTESVTSDPAARAVSPTEADHSLAVLSRHAMSVRATGSAPTSVTVANGPVSLRITWDERASVPAGDGDTAGHLMLVPTDTAADSSPVAARPADDGAASTFPLTAETVGVFYHAPEPGAAPFVAVGDPVRAGQQVGIIEAMKLMIPVTATREGVVAEILVDNGDAVEHGQALIVFEALR